MKAATDFEQFLAEIGFLEAGCDDLSSKGRGSGSEDVDYAELFRGNYPEWYREGGECPF